MQHCPEASVTMSGMGQCFTCDFTEPAWDALTSQTKHSSREFLYVISIKFMCEVEWKWKLFKWGIPKELSRLLVPNFLLYEQVWMQRLLMQWLQF